MSPLDIAGSVLWYQRSYMQSLKLASDFCAASSNILFIKEFIDSVSFFVAEPPSDILGLISSTTEAERAVLSCMDWEGTRRGGSVA